MGVPGLWNLLLPSAVRINPTDLRGKVLAIDTSIWIHQFLNVNNEANRIYRPFVVVLRGFFRRIAKILFYGIKPVFIFDGKRPILKEKTLRRRRERKHNEEKRIKYVAKQILQKKKKEDPNEEDKAASTKSKKKVYSFAKRGMETGEVNFEALDDDDDFDIEFDEEESDVDEDDITTSEAVGYMNPNEFSNFQRHQFVMISEKKKKEERKAQKKVDECVILSGVLNSDSRIGLELRNNEFAEKQNNDQKEIVPVICLDDLDDDILPKPQVVPKVVKPPSVVPHFLLQSNNEELQLMKELSSLLRDKDDDDDEIPNVTEDINDNVIDLDDIEDNEEEIFEQYGEEFEDLDGIDEEDNQELLSSVQQTNIDMVVKNEILSGIVELLKILGIPYVLALEEADSQCAYLNQVGLIDGVISDDSDLLVFGAKKVYKNFFSNREFVHEFNTASIERVLGIDRVKIIQLALLLGSDYTDGVKNIGIVFGMQIIEAFQQNFGTGDTIDIQVYSPLKEFLKWLSQKSPKKKKKKKKKGDNDVSRLESFKKRYSASKKRFIPLDEDFPSRTVIKEYISPLVDRSNEKFSWNETNYEHLNKFSEKYMYFSEEEVKQLLEEPIAQQMTRNDASQRNINLYVTKKKKVAVVKSKRLKDAISHLKNGDLEEPSKKKAKKRKRRGKGGKKKRKKRKTE